MTNIINTMHGHRRAIYNTTCLTIPAPHAQKTHHWEFRVWSICRKRQTEQ